MKSKKDVVDLTDDQQVSQQQQGRLEELTRIESEIGALKTRHEVLVTELEIETTDKSANPHKAFLDDGFDVFATPSAQAMESLDDEDEEFEQRFAVFAANDEEGDHKARRWFDSA